MCKLPVLLNPNWRQITLASLVPNLELQTLPQALLIHTSTRPRVVFSPPTNLTSPWLQLPAEVDDSSDKHITIKTHYTYKLQYTVTHAIAVMNSLITLTYNPSNSSSYT